MCKFYQGGEDKLLETKLKRLFEKVHRDKPSASRSVRTPLYRASVILADTIQESKEGYFVALRRKGPPLKEEVFAE